MKQAALPANIADVTNLIRTSLISGTNDDNTPTETPIELMLENPHKAYVAIVIALCEMVLLSTIRASFAKAANSLTMILVPMRDATFKQSSIGTPISQANGKKM